MQKIDTWNIEEGILNLNEEIKYFIQSGNLIQSVIPIAYKYVNPDVPSSEIIVAKAIIIYIPVNEIDNLEF